MATNVNYVKFLRGTPTAFANLATKDSNTLYFISEKNSNIGKLYLGDVLIAGGSAGDLEGLSLEDIANVSINAGVEDGSFLVYNSLSEKWENMSAEDVFSMVIGEMIGATATKNGKAGLVPVPVRGEQDLFLKASGEWANPTEGLEATIKVLVGTDGDGKSIKDIAIEALAESLIPEGAKESRDTLKEIADWIQDHPDDVTDLNSRLKSLEEAVFDQESEEEDGETIPGLVTTVGDLQSELTSLRRRTTNVESSITDIYEKLVWHDMSDIDGTTLN